MEEELGWLDPNGTLYKCDYTWHLDTAYEIYGTYNTEELAQRGIVHLFWNPIHNRNDYFTKRILTDAQIAYLRDHNYKIYEEDLPHYEQ